MHYLRIKKIQIITVWYKKNKMQDILLKMNNSWQSFNKDNFCWVGVCK